MINALIVDDERLARKELRKLLENHQEIKVIGECANADEAIQQVDELKPDLVFLDIQMPEKTGFDMLEEISFTPDVIFVTAYDEHAIKAFEVNAIDYLLKPVEPERLEEAILKVIKNRRDQQSQADKEILDEEDQIFVKDRDRYWFVKLKNVRMFESEGNYVRVYFDNFKPLVLKSLNNLSLRLNSRKFFRANRKFIINLSWVENIESWFNGGLMVKLKSGEQIEISRRQAAKLKEMMSL